MLKRAPSTARLAGSPERLAALFDLWQTAERDVWITLQGFSMTPTITPDSRLRVQCRHYESTSALQSDALIAYRSGSALVVHRLIAIRADKKSGKDLLVCKGDANPDPDLPVTLDLVVGTVVEIRPPSAAVLARRLAARCIRRVRRFADGLKAGAKTNSPLPHG